MKSIAENRTAQQPYLTANNTHFRGNAADYPILTRDLDNRTYLHPSTTLRVAELRTDQFIQKNLKEELTANYHNEVVKYENYAYQQRKKRRHFTEAH